MGTALLLLSSARITAQQKLTAHTVHLADGRTLTLNLPDLFTIDIAAQGLRRARFFAVSPEGRVFVTDMYNRADNSLGRVYILDGWNPAAHTFSRTTTYLDHLRNPNNLAFYTDPATHQSWLYLPLTDRLLRYKYSAGDKKPEGPPEVLARYPDYGLNYKYGGWHLTRTVAFATLHGHTRLFVSVGSSCNACQEKEAVRASVQMMEPDGSHPMEAARGLRNAVGLAFFPSLDGGALFATNMGADHLGDAEPEETFFELDSNKHPTGIAQSQPDDYGWPTCYFAGGAAHADPLVSAPKPTDHIFPPPPAGPPPRQFDCERVPAAYNTFAAHSSPLGFEYFDASNPMLKGSFLVALHGAGHPQIGTGYRVVRFTAENRRPQDFITGFLVNKGGKAVVKGRPCGLLRIGTDSFLLTDDLDGVVYSIHPR